MNQDVDARDLPSLFVLSLPRSLSSVVYSVSRRAMGLREPEWTDSGEILNLDRHVLMGWPQLRDSAKFVTAKRSPQRFERIVTFLDQTVVARGFAYKDVVHPFAVAAWPRLRELAVLKIRRDVTEVAMSMIDRGWSYPATAVTADIARPGLRQRLASRYLWDVALRRASRRVAHDRRTARLLRDEILMGLLLAQRALDGIAGEELSYDDATTDPEALRSALRRLYPHTEVPTLAYVDERFARRRAELEERRRSPRYARVAARVERLRASMD